MTTGIQWTDETWNPIRGCTRVSAGCQNCYAEAVAARFSGPGLAYEGLARRRSNGEPQWTGVVRVIPEHMLDPIRWRRPRRVFVNSMSDLFHESLPFEEVATIFAVMALAPQHTFQVLTKRPERMREFFRWVEAEGVRLRDTPDHEPWDGANVVTHHAGIRLDRDDRFVRFERALDAVSDGPTPEWPLENVWLGVSVEHQAAADERIPELLLTPAAVRFISAEPLLAPVDLSTFLDYEGYVDDRPTAALDWVIVGGESGRHARPCDVAWIRQIVDCCALYETPVFVKQLGARPLSVVDHISHRGDDTKVPDGFYRFLNDSHGGDMAEWPEDLRVREFPSTAGARP